MFFFFGIRDSNPRPCIYYTLSLVIKLSSHRHSFCFLECMIRIMLLYNSNHCINSWFHVFLDILIRITVKYTTTSSNHVFKKKLQDFLSHDDLDTWYSNYSKRLIWMTISIIIIFFKMILFINSSFISSLINS